MFDFPEILPADPAAPEHHRKPGRRLHYGTLAKMILKQGDQR